jgi:hypothetical protein
MKTLKMKSMILLASFPKGLGPSHLTLQRKSARQVMKRYTYLARVSVNKVCTQGLVLAALSLFGILTVAQDCRLLS